MRTIKSPASVAESGSDFDFDCVVAVEEAAAVEDVAAGAVEIDSNLDSLKQRQPQKQ